MSKRVIAKLRREVNRVALLIALGVFVIVTSPWLALEVGIPALSPWGLFLGGTFIVAALSHIMRRILFPYLDLQLIAEEAVRNKNVPAALIFLSVCIVLATFLAMTGSMLRI